MEHYGMIAEAKNCRAIAEARVTRGSPSINETEILQSVFLKLLPTDVLTCRLVSGQWSDIGGKFLSKTVAVTMRYDQTSSEYKSRKGASLQKLVETIKSRGKAPSSKFPFTHFNFEGGNLNSNDVKLFLSLYGHFIKKLSLNLVSSDKPYQEINTLRHLLLNGAPNLEILALTTIPGGTRLCEDEIQLFPEPRGQIKLPCMKQLTLPAGILVNKVVNYEVKDGQRLQLSKNLNFGTQFSSPARHQRVPEATEFEYKYPVLILDLLGAAVNLEQLEGFPLRWIDHLEKLDKIHTIKSLQFLWREREEWEQIRKLADFTTRLQKITFTSLNSKFDPGQEVATVINKILSSSKRTLIKIDGLFHLSCLANVKVPRMKHVTSLTFDLKCGYPNNQSRESESEMMQNQSWRVLPSNNFFAEMFPALQQINFEGPYNPPNHIGSSFFDPSLDRLPSLKILKISSGCTDQLVQQFGFLFPKVRRLSVVVAEFQNFPQILSSIFTSFKLLQELRVGVANVRRNLDICAKADSAITGLPEEECEKIRKISRSVSIETANGLRVRPSILDLRDLRSFVMTFTGASSRQNIRGGEMRRIFSHVAGIYGFQAVKDRQNVQMVVKHKTSVYSGQLEEALAPIVPYVDGIVDEYEIGSTNNFGRLLYMHDM